MSGKWKSKQIQILKAHEVVRKRPEMYLGSLDNPNLNTKLVFQSLCHAIDEVLDEKCSEISIFINNLYARVFYDAGMPLDVDNLGEKLPAAVSFFSELKACKNRKKHSEVGEEYCELGLFILNAVCESMEAKITSEGRFAHLKFRQGILEKPVEISETQGENSTEIQFKLDSEILNNIAFNIEQIKTEAQKLMMSQNVKISVYEL